MTDRGTTTNLSRAHIALLAITAGFAIANNYTLQPLLPAVLQSFNLSLSTAGWIAGAPSLGYMIGLILLLPLGDRFELRRIVFLQVLALSFCLLAIASSPTFTFLIASSIISGILSTVAAQCAALGARLAGDKRGSVVGSIAMGISVGILLGRTIGGGIGEILGWRGMVVIMAGFCFVMTAVAYRFLPTTPASETSTKKSYASLLRSVPQSFREHPVLSYLTAAGSAWFAMFCGIWATLALYVASPVFSYGPAAAGAFGLIGASGAIASQIAGRSSDRFGANWVMLVALGLALTGVTILLFFSHALAGMITGILIMDIGCFAAQAANQARILSVSSNNQSRNYSAYMIVYYGAGTLGALIAPIVYGVFGWRGVCVWCLTLCVAALGLATVAGRVGQALAPATTKSPASG